MRELRWATVDLERLQILMAADPAASREGWRGAQPGLTLYGLRHTVAVILREIGMDERTIADALGQRTTEMARCYAKGADLAPKMRTVARKFEAELNKRETRVVKPGRTKCQTS